MKNKMFLYFCFTLLFCFNLFNGCSNISYREDKVPTIDVQLEQEIKNLYRDCKLAGKLRYDIFQKALLGHKYITFENPNIITIIDYSRPSTEKRCFVIDISKRKVIYNTLIAHGKNSGENYATLFSNINNSKQSSLGFFKTSDTYMGSNGYSIQLDGLEKDINHYARKREIVIHGADYVSQEFIDENGRLGRSWGCPAFPKDLSTEIIDIIKGGSCIYVYADDEKYLTKSYYIAEKMSFSPNEILNFPELEYPVHLPVAKRADWGWLPIDTTFKTHKIQFITVHHGGVEFLKGSDPIKHVRNLQSWSRAEKKWIDIPYHFMIDPDGKIFEARPINIPGDTNTEYDPTNHVLIEVMGNYEIQEFGEKQFGSMIELIKFLSIRFDVPVDMVKTHKDYSNLTVCPGMNIYKLFSDGSVKRALTE